MKRFALSMVIMTMVFGTVSLDVYAKGNGRSSGRSGRSSMSRSSHSGARRSSSSRSPQRYQSRSTSSRSPQRSTSRNSTTRNVRQPQTRTTRNHRGGKTTTFRDHRGTTTRPRVVNSAPKPRPTMKPINGRPMGNGATRPQTKPFTGMRPRPGNGAPKPRPSIKPIDPGIGNRRPGNGGIRPRPGNGAPKPRPSIKPIDSGIGNGRPGSGGIRPRPGNGAPKPRPTIKPIDPGIGNGRPGNGGIRPRPGNGAPKPRPNGPHKPVPGHHGGGNGGGGHHGNGHGNGNGHGHHNGHHGKPWFHARPNYCRWWFNYCTPLQNCRPADLHYCDYIYPTCDYVTPGGLVVEDARWYLGMKGMMLPGKGVGVESVEPDSPAAAAGLAPGMVITKCNGVAITDNDVLAQVIAESGGVLEMELYEKLDGPLMGTTVEMIRLPAASF